MKRTSIVPFFLLFFCIVAYSQRIKYIPPEKPKLVVQIVVEQMRADYIARFWDDFGQSGFKRLATGGTVCERAVVGYGSTQTASGYATLASGTFPMNHGIVADSWYNRVSGEKESAIVDDDYKVVGGRPKGNYFSPQKMQVSTFTDELQLFYSGRSKVIAVCLRPSGVHFLAGHFASGAYWFDSETGNWVTSSYFRHSLPDWVNAFNQKGLPGIYVQKEWKPSKLITDYSACLSDKNRYEIGYHGQNTFPYSPLKLSQSKNGYDALYKLPKGNTFTKDFAIHAIVGEELGKDDVTDYLSVAFSVTEEIGTAFGTESIELRDAYIKLDEELGFFLDFLSSECGLSNVLVCLTSNHGVSHNSDFLKDKHMPSGEFKHRKAIVLLNSYLNALYGQGEWVSYYDNLQLYLNHILIEDSRLDLREVQEKASQFLIQVSGVSKVFTASQMMESYSTDKIFRRIANSYNPQRSGDLYVLLKAGWTEQVVDVSCVHNSPYNSDNAIPLIWYGWKVEKQKIRGEVSLADVAPTLSMLLGVPLPSMATGVPIVQLTDKK